MLLPRSRRQDPPLPGVIGTARVDRRTRTLLPRLRKGDVVVLDHTDLDRATAQAIVDAEVAAVVNASRFVSGRYPSRGPAVLLDAGIELVDHAGREILAAVKDGQEVRVHEGRLLVGDEDRGGGTVLDREALDADLEAARSGMVVQLERLAHDSAEFVRRESGVLLHNRGIPALRARVADRPVLVVAPGPELDAELDLVDTWVREQRPVVIAVDSAATVLHSRKRRADVLVVTAAGRDDSGGTVPPKAVKAAKDVIVVAEPGGRSDAPAVDRVGVRPEVFETTATAEDAALLLAVRGDASLVVGAGAHASLDDFLDRQRGGLSSTYLTRLKVGDRLVDARAVPALYSGRLHAWHLWAVLVLGLLALLAAVAITPVGQDVVDQLRDPVVDLASSLFSYVEGLF
jgi:uncharacterized membrane-anchored protein